MKCPLIETLLQKGPPMGPSVCPGCGRQRQSLQPADEVHVCSNSLGMINGSSRKRVFNLNMCSQWKVSVLVVVGSPSFI